MQDVWVNGDLSAIETYFHPDAKLNGLISGPSLSRSEYSEWVAQFQSMATLSNPRRVSTFPEAGGQVAYEIEATLTAQINGLSYDVRAMYIERIQDGRVIESRAFIDLLQFFEGIGALPKHSTLMMLTGAKLA